MFTFGDVLTSFLFGLLLGFCSMAFVNPEKVVDAYIKLSEYRTRRRNNGQSN